MKVWLYCISAEVENKLRLYINTTKNYKLFTRLNYDTIWYKIGEQL